MTVIETMPRSIGLAARYGQSHPRLVDVLIALSWVILSAPTLVISVASPTLSWATGWVAGVLFG